MSTPAHNQNTAHTTLRELQISLLLEQGYSTIQIAAELQLSVNVIRKHQARIEERWIAASIDAINRLKARKLAELRAVLREAWHAYRLSAEFPNVVMPDWLADGQDLVAGGTDPNVRRDAPVVDSETGAIVVASQVDLDDLPPPPMPKAQKPGDIAYLKVVLDVLAQERALLGLDAPKKVMEIPLDPKELESMSVEDLEAMQNAILRGSSHTLELR